VGFGGSVGEDHRELRRVVVLPGAHAVALTIADGLFDQRGSSGYHAFLSKFVPDTRPGYDFASIAEEIHDWRNVIAHRWLSHQGHQVALDPTISVGWMRKDGILHLNPAIYADAYLAAFGAGGRIWDWERLLTADEAGAAKQRLIDNYMRGS
jgi:hypothetical protein